MKRLGRVRYRVRHRFGFSIGKHWHCAACKRHWRLYRNAHQHVYSERMPCRRTAEAAAKR